MQLVSPGEAHLKELMTWFSNQQELDEWGGPNFEFPIIYDAFQRNLKLDSLDSFVLVDVDNALLGFGQFYLRLGRCHLGRLAIAPKRRGEGLVAELMTQLIRIGLEKLAVHSSSLFVMKRNHAAISAYRKHGFEPTPYPETIPYKDCLYMVRRA